MEYPSIVVDKIANLPLLTKPTSVIFDEIIYELFYRFIILNYNVTLVPFFILNARKMFGIIFHFSKGSYKNIFAVIFLFWIIWLYFWNGSNDENSVR